MNGFVHFDIMALELQWFWLIRLLRASLGRMKGYEWF